MVNFKREGKTLKLTALANCTKSKFVVCGDRALVATETASTGDVVEMLAEGVVSYAMHSNETVALGEKLYFDSGNDYLTKTSSGNKPAGWAAKAVASASTIEVKLGAW